MDYIVLACIFFSFGYLVGAYLKTAAYDNQDWKILRWDKKSLGFRQIQVGTYIERGDNLMLAVPLDSQQLPDEKVKYR
tara:strand:- start:587 stop:820 length:234 start_codon:yes stop_codon:yes gene_type:complete